MDCESIFFSGHAIRRMFERSIGRREVIDIVRLGEIIAEYPDDEPFPSSLILGFVEIGPQISQMVADSKTGEHMQ
jgi:hypothetical protein